MTDPTNKDTGTINSTDAVPNPMEVTMTSNETTKVGPERDRGPSLKAIDFNAIRSRDFADPADVTSLLSGFQCGNRMVIPFLESTPVKITGTQLT